MLHRFKQSPQLQRLTAGLLAIIGIILITVASCSSTPGPPQPASSDVTRSAASAPAAVASAPQASSPTSEPAPTSEQSVELSPAAVPSAAESPVAAAPETSQPSVASQASVAEEAPQNPDNGLILPAAQPIKIDIPSLGVSSKMIDVGLNLDGTVEVPPLDDPESKPGWFRQSPAPGVLGPSIILGHVDSKKYGPGSFYKLGAMQVGDKIDVTRDDGTVAVFNVDEVQSILKSEFPTEKVYGNIDNAGLRLITCGGEFDPNARSYESNIIVYASLESSHPA
ncbi:class F sortase [Nakamurella antarctica]|uniref:Class F sortase n=1 Tax=Nakamurella antarctica TaxID=1902245 RepID=A0A3G8ZM01_9ACTN|nr:class F sortase [Nakamurella antarctica]AZI58293.1 class F sortase [Nakamurella antarctica]